MLIIDSLMLRLMSMGQAVCVAILEWEKSSNRKLFRNRCIRKLLYDFSRINLGLPEASYRKKSKKEKDEIAKGA